MFIKFGFNTPGYHCLGKGWGAPEANHVWALGHEAAIMLPGIAPSPFGILLTMAVSTHIPEDRRQVLSVRLNGREIGMRSLLRAEKLMFRLAPDHPLHDGINLLEITAAQALSPVQLHGQGDDHRVLSFSLDSIWITPMLDETALVPTQPPRKADHDLMTGFESLGDDCEFGFVQKDYGVATPSLLRFGGMRLHRLLEAMRNRFEGIESPENLSVFVRDGAEYMVTQERYRYAYHTFVSPEEMSAEKLVEQESRRLGFCKRMLLDDLEDGEKIFVIKSSAEQRAPLADVLALATELRKYGTGTLMWVLPEDKNRPTGHFHWHADNLLEARIDFIAPSGHAVYYSPFWLHLCRQARFVVEQRATLETSFLPLPHVD